MVTDRLIIGSNAIKHYYPDFPRQPKDIDIVVLDSRSREGITEYLVNPVILKHQQNGYLSPNLMLSLKISHLFWDINWEKHIFDTQFLLSKGCGYDINIVNELRLFWDNFLPKIRRSRLEMSKEEFFTNSVNENVNQHDYLHTLLNPTPMYKKLLKDGCEVELEESKWHKLSFEEKHDVVFEEVVIMMTERYKNTDYRVAYKRQLKQCIIKHFPFYISIFAIENYTALEKYKRANIKNFWNELGL